MRFIRHLYQIDPPLTKEAKQTEDPEAWYRGACSDPHYADQLAKTPLQFRSCVEKATNSTESEICYAMLARTEINADSVAAKPACTGHVTRAGSATLRGRVRDFANQPIEGATVLLTPASDPQQSLTALTDAQGEYEVTALVPDQYNIDVHGLNRQSQRSCIAVDGGETTVVDFVH